MQELAFWAADTSARAMEELRSESDGQNEASVAPSDQSVGYGTSGDDFGQEQVAGCESCGESDSEDLSSEADEDAATDADAAPEDIPACSMRYRHRSPSSNRLKRHHHLSCERLNHQRLNRHRICRRHLCRHIHPRGTASPRGRRPAFRHRPRRAQRPRLLSRSRLRRL